MIKLMDWFTWIMNLVQRLHILELVIETNPEFRGLGLAKIVCARLIDYTLAQSLGFVPVRELAYYQFKA